MPRKETMRCEWVRCGNPRCGACPHGPYWYAYWREAGKLHKRYVGKEAAKAEPEAPKCSPNLNHPHDVIFNGKTASRSVAFQILGVPNPSDHATTKAAFRRKSFELHPDRGGNELEFKRVVCAWAFLKTWFGWK